MIDIHMHILPQLDDGAQSLEDSMDMIRMMLDQDITAGIATSHGNLGYYTIEEYREAYREVVNEIKRQGLPFTLYPGMEILMTPGVPKRLKENKLLTLNNTDYVLCEFDFGIDRYEAQGLLLDVRRAGYKPIVAHVERYDFTWYHPETVEDLRKSGCVIQVNKGSLVGALGRKEQELACGFLEEGLVHVIATDAHNVRKRTPYMENALEVLEDLVDPEEIEVLLERNPRRILAGRTVIDLKV